LYCDDPQVIGDSFYVMERRQGVILRGPKAPPPLADDPRLARQVSESLIDNLARLHRLDYQAAGLGDLGRPEGYVDRQVGGWTQRYHRARTDDWPELEQLAAWLADHRPESARAALIHNDYKYDNLILDPLCLTRIVALLDWEMATIGDPLMDLGTSLAYWVEAKDPAPLQAMAFGPTMIAGSLTRRQLIERYARQTGMEVEQPLFYYAFGLFKLAVIVQQIYARYVRGHTRDPRFATLNQVVGCLGEVGVRALESGDL
jgi:aminoglycoside phosphotransferase (APT) family kinase protein